MAHVVQPPREGAQILTREGDSEGGYNDKVKFQAAQAIMHAIASAGASRHVASASACAMWRLLAGADASQGKVDHVLDEEVQARLKAVEPALRAQLTATQHTGLNHHTGKAWSKRTCWFRGTRLCTPRNSIWIGRSRGTPSRSCARRSAGRDPWRRHIDPNITAKIETLSAKTAQLEKVTAGLQSKLSSIADQAKPEYMWPSALLPGSNAANHAMPSERHSMKAGPTDKCITNLITAKLRRAVLSVLRDPSADPDGVPINLIARKVGRVCGEDFRAVLAVLEDEGDIYSNSAGDRFVVTFPADLSEGF